MVEIEPDIPVVHYVVCTPQLKCIHYTDCKSQVMLYDQKLLNLLHCTLTIVF